MSPRTHAHLSSGDADEANMDVELPDEEELHELNFDNLEDSEYEPTTEDILDDYSVDDWE